MLNTEVTHTRTNVDGSIDTGFDYYGTFIFEHDLLEFITNDSDHDRVYVEAVLEDAVFKVEFAEGTRRDFDDFLDDNDFIGVVGRVLIK